MSIISSNDNRTGEEKDDRRRFFEQSPFTTLSVSDASRILSYYSDQPYRLHRTITGGINNSNYYIVSEDGSHYFCKICNERTADNVWIQIKTLISLQSFGLPLAYPLKCLNDKSKNQRNSDDEILNSNYIVHLNSIKPPIVMYEWKHGRTIPLMSLSPASYTSLGAALARIHSIDINEFFYLPLFSFGLSRMLPLYYEELRTLPSSLQQHPFVTIWETELQHICQKLYHRTPYEIYKDRNFLIKKSKTQNNSLPLAILHGDIFLENVLFRKDGEVDAIIDWEYISIGERLIDVTMTIVGCCYHNNDSLSIDRTKAFLSAYQKILPFTSCERNCFVTFLRYSLLSIACYRWYRFNVQFPLDERANSYLSMIKRINALDSEDVQQLLSS